MNSNGKSVSYRDRVSGGDLLVEKALSTDLKIVRREGAVTDPMAKFLSGPRGSRPVRWCPCGSLNRLDVLSQREREVLVELRDGPTNRQLATRLIIAEETVKDHLRHIFAKLSIRTRVQASLIGYLAYFAMVLPQPCDCKR